MAMSAKPRGRVLHQLSTTLKAAAAIVVAKNSDSASVNDGDDNDLACVSKVDPGEIRLYSYFGALRVWRLTCSCD